MLYLTPPTGSPAVHAAIKAGELGIIDTPRQGTALIQGDTAWAADNGCFTRGFPGDEAWLAWLRRHPADRTRCLFATVPDVPGDFEATLIRSRPHLDTVRKLGYPVALVAQDGMEWSTYEPWAEIDVLFVGGSTDWKLGISAAAIVADARARSIPVHMGRVNSTRRAIYAAGIGCSSADGTLLTFGPDRWVDVARSWSRVAGQTVLL